jgi:uncharacterized membrane protein
MKFNPPEKIALTNCHRLPERSFFWKQKQFLLCARCTGIYIGYFTLPLFILDLIAIPFYWTILMIVPTYIDGFVQAYFNKESTNNRRFITGLISGIGTMSLVSIIGLYIASLLKLLIN